EREREQLRGVRQRDDPRGRGDRSGSADRRSAHRPRRLEEARPRVHHRWRWRDARPGPVRGAPAQREPDVHARLERRGDRAVARLELRPLATPGAAPPALSSLLRTRAAAARAGAAWLTALARASPDGGAP